MDWWKILVATLITAMFLPGLKAHVTLETRLTGKIYHPGDKINIIWSVLVEHDPVDWDLHFSKDGGETWEPIEEGLPLYQLTYEWIAPDIESAQLLIQITQDNDMTEDYYDRSDTFAIMREEVTPVFDLAGQSLSVSVYPNPVRDQAHLTISDVPSEGLSVNIYTEGGLLVDQLVRQQVKDREADYWWKTGHLPSGLYLVSLQYRDRVRSFPVLVRH